MKAQLVAAILLTCLPGAPASAHRLDEYLQATTISLEKDRVQAQIRLTPGVAVLAQVMSAMDTDRDGALSGDEQQAYAKLVLHDLSIRVGGHPLPLQLVSAKFPPMDATREGLGEIQIDFTAAVPHGSADPTLIFENKHQQPIATYLVNTLVPADSSIRIVTQKRNYEQSWYELKYVQHNSVDREWLTPAALVLLAPLPLLWHRQRSRATKNEA